MSEDQLTLLQHALDRRFGLTAQKLDEIHEAVKHGFMRIDRVLELLQHAVHDHEKRIDVYELQKLVKPRKRKARK